MHHECCADTEEHESEYQFAIARKNHGSPLAVLGPRGRASLCRPPSEKCCPGPMQGRRKLSGSTPVSLASWIPAQLQCPEVAWREATVVSSVLTRCCVQSRHVHQQGSPLRSRQQAGRDSVTAHAGHFCLHLFVSGRLFLAAAASGGVRPRHT
ncbi:hypothetical protein EYF80_005446 [Liparis tanakae]|uniref:Uncharacterized protein n=1 Tax=Liparis tanakae TaxID=230148 RepID=A0A4Z2J1M1_9TELE|nr:hypothetical protein EYF80_005446 [Liparis tanakae]